MRGDRRRTISNRMVAALEVERDTVFWDRELKGFGVRAYPGGGRVYVAQARGPKGPRRVTVGRHGVLNAEEAKRRAALIIARVKAGEDPVPEPLAAKLAQGPRVTDIDGAWQTLRERAGLKGVRLHDLRHSYASRALALGESLPMIGKLLGHSQVETTARYAHLARESVHEAAARIADSIAADVL